MTRLLKSSSIVMAGDLITKLLSILYLIPLAIIDPRIAVITSYLLIPFALVIVLSNAGVSTITSVRIIENDQKNFDQVKTQSLAGSSIILFMSFLGMIVMYMCAPYFAQVIVPISYQEIIPDLIVSYRIMSMGVLIYGLLTLTRMIMMSKMEYKKLSYTNILEQLIKIFFIVVISYIVVINKDIVYYKTLYVTAYGIILSMFVVLAMNSYFIYKAKHYRIYFEGNSLLNITIFKTLFISSIIYIASSFYATAFDNIDLFSMNYVLSNIGMDPDKITQINNEYFGYSLKIVMIPIQLTTNFILVMIKELSTNENPKKQFNEIIVVVVAFGLISTSGIYVVGPDLYNILTAGIVSIGIVRIQGFIVSLYILKNVVSGYMVTCPNYEKIAINSTIIIIFSKVVLLYVLAPIFKMYVFTLSSVAALIIGCVYIFYAGRSSFALDKLLLKKLSSLLVKVLIITIVFNYVGGLINLSSIYHLIIVGTLLLTTLLFTIVPKEHLISFKNKLFHSKTQVD